ncbi:MAG: hypothetical protein KDK39_00500 [Leptospiraceae bacterium]|nr:hypothetical protein [Leptospiraceae bacterium]
MVNALPFATSAVLISNLTVILYIYRGRYPFNLVFFTLFSGAWAVSLAMELHWELAINSLLTNHPGNQTGMIFFDLLTRYSTEAPQLPQRLIELRYLSFGTDSLAAIGLAFLLKIASFFPPRTWCRHCNLILFLAVASVIASAFFGLQVGIENGRVFQRESPLVFINIVYTGLCITAALLILFSKSRDYSSPLRGLEARYLPGALFSGLFFSALFGYLAVWSQDSQFYITIACLGPLLYTILLLGGYYQSRRLLTPPYNYQSLNRELDDCSSLTTKIRLLLQRDFIITLFIRTNAEEWTNDLLRSEKLIADPFLSRLEARPGARAHYAFCEDYDFLPDHPGFLFFKRQYAQALVLKQDKLIIVHRIQNNKIVSRRDLQTLARALGLQE